MVNLHSKNITFKQDPKSKGLVIVISKKVARLAVNRNKLRRRIKEVIRIEKASQQDLNVLGYLYTRKGIAELNFAELEKEIKEILVKID